MPFDLGYIPPPRLLFSGDSTPVFTPTSSRPQTLESSLILTAHTTRWQMLSVPPKPPQRSPSPHFHSVPQIPLWTLQQPPPSLVSPFCPSWSRIRGPHGSSRGLLITDSVKLESVTVAALPLPLPNLTQRTHPHWPLPQSCEHLATGLQPQRSPGGCLHSSHIPAPVGSSWVGGPCPTPPYNILPNPCYSQPLYPTLFFRGLYHDRNSALYLFTVLPYS